MIKGIDLIRDELPEYARGTYAGRIQEQFRFLCSSIPSEVLRTDRRVLEIGSGLGGAILALGNGAGLAEVCLEVNCGGYFDICEGGLKVRQAVFSVGIKTLKDAEARQ